MYSENAKQNVLKMISEGKSVKEISEACNISVPTIYKWKREFTSAIALEKISDLISKTKLEEAIEICKKYELDEQIQYKYISIL